MALILKDGSIFLHIPKTGGNWVTEVLYEQGLVACELNPNNKHVDFSHLLTATGGTPQRRFNSWLRSLRGRAKINMNYLTGNKPYFFCFVRNPVSWYESYFKYMSQPSVAWKHFGDARSLKDWHPNAILNDTGSDDFNQFVRNVLDRRPGYVTELYSGYTLPGLIDFVGTQENLREDLIHVLKTRKLEFDAQAIRGHCVIGASIPPPSVRVEWDAEVRRRVMELERVAMDRYGYGYGYGLRLTSVASIEPLLKRVPASRPGSEPRYSRW